MPGPRVAVDDRNRGDMLTSPVQVRSARRRRVILETCCVVAFGWIAPGMAAAATVDGDVDGRRGEYGQTTFTAAAGEVNRVRITLDRRGYIVFTDRRNPVVAIGGCDRVDAHTARCETDNHLARALLGDGDDRAVIDTNFVVVRGGSGDDRLTGSGDAETLWGNTGDDTLRGAGGDDQLTGGAGRDRLYGGPGADLLSDAETGGRTSGDLFDGGPGGGDPGAFSGDTVNFYGQRGALRIDLGTGTTNTTDRLLGIESIIGGRGDDRLTGDDGPNVLTGGPGSNVVRGGAGDDIVSGGDDDDELDGEDGNDTVWGYEGLDALSGGTGDDLLVGEEETGRQQPDTVACDAGADTVRSGRSDTLAADCETVGGSRSELTIRAVPYIDADSADFTLRCGSDTRAGCAGTITLRAAGGQRFGAARFLAPGDGTDTVISVAINAAGITALRAGAVVRVDVRSDEPDSRGSGSYRIVLRAPAM